MKFADSYMSDHPSADWILNCAAGKWSGNSNDNRMGNTACQVPPDTPLLAYITNYHYLLKAKAEMDLFVEGLQTWVSTQCQSNNHHKFELFLCSVIMSWKLVNDFKIMQFDMFIINVIHDIRAIITGSNKGKRVWLSLEPSESRLPIKMRRRQFPIILAFVLTIKKKLEGNLLTKWVFTFLNQYLDMVNYILP